MPLKGRKIGFLGGGAMGEALLTGLIRTGLAPSELYVSDISAPRLDYLKQKLGVNITTDNVSMVKGVDIVILAVKPQLAAGVLKKIAVAMSPGQTFISIAAGITTGLIESYLEGHIPVIRVMPNTPCLVGEGASAVSAGKYAGEESVARAMAVFAAAGKAVEVPESLLDCVTGLSGSGPAYMYMILEGFIDGAVRLGLPRQVAKELIAQTMLGSARMVLESDEHPGKLKDMVTTPGGTTIAGLFTLEEGSLRALLMKAVAAAAQRSRELSG
jgi:pyrroline-5-carboxylate reductase